MAYTDIDKPTDYFNTVAYTGTSTTPQNVTVGFQPDWVWIKGRSFADAHYIYDSIRGVTNAIHSHSTSAEGSNVNSLTAFNSDGFTVGSEGGVNGNGQTLVSWNWLASNTTASNTNGSITSTVSANTTAGFSIVSYTGTGSASTVGHGLSSTPQVYIIKNRSNARNWQSYHEPLGNQAYLRLNTTGAASTGASIWNNTSPTSSVFSIGTSSFDAVNSSGDNYIAYCFAEKKGFSKFGSYTGNGSTDGTFVYTGFKPAFLILKRYDSTNNWYMYNNKVNPYNETDRPLKADTSESESTIFGGNELDFLSNGFKLRDTLGATNGSGASYIYMCFAENPFVTGASGIPTTAR